MATELPEKPSDEAFDKVRAWLASRTYTSIVVERQARAVLRYLLAEHDARPAPVGAAKAAVERELCGVSSKKGGWAMAGPTDDELAKWHEDYFGCAVYDAGTIPAFRAALAAENVRLAAARLERAGWSREATQDIARALRSRFPQPITDAVLRAEGFEPGVDSPWAVRCGRVLVRGWRRDTDGTAYLQWDASWEVVRTPDRLHRVVECLRELYAPGEDG